MKTQLPTLDEERALLGKGYDIVVGIDEVGRGPLAGPVLSCACFFDVSNYEIEKKLLSLGVKDSKKITPKKRKEISDLLKKEGFVTYALGLVDEKMIDEINILEASLLSMRKAFENLNISSSKKVCLLVDGKEIIPDISTSQKAIIKGDSKSLCIAAASVLAKVARDEIMEKYAETYPEYGFEKHKGYGTKLHFEAIKEHGPCLIHRNTFLHDST